MNTLKDVKRLLQKNNNVGMEFIMHGILQGQVQLLTLFSIIPGGYEYYFTTSYFIHCI